MAFWYKKLMLAILLLSLEIISFVLDQIGGSNGLFLVASFLLAAIGFVTTIYTSLFSSTVPAVTRSESERQLIAVDIVFSFIQLVCTFIHLIWVFLGAKSSNNNNESLLPLAFAVISVVFIFRNNEEAQVVSDSASVSQIISTETPAFVDESAIQTPAFVDESEIRRVPSTLLRHRQHKQKVVIQVSMNGQNSRSKALKILVGVSGVESAALKGDDKSQIEVTGDGFDPTVLTQLLRKKVGHAELVTCEEQKDEKKENEAVQVVRDPYSAQNRCSIM